MHGKFVKDIVKKLLERKFPEVEELIKEISPAEKLSLETVREIAQALSREAIDMTLLKEIWMKMGYNGKLIAAYTLSYLAEDSPEIVAENVPVFIPFAESARVCRIIAREILAKIYSGSDLYEIARLLVKSRSKWSRLTALMLLSEMATHEKYEIDKIVDIILSTPFKLDYMSMMELSRLIKNIIQQNPEKLTEIIVEKSETLPKSIKEIIVEIAGQFQNTGNKNSRYSRQSS